METNTEIEPETEINESDIYGAMESLDLSWLEEEEQFLNLDNYVVKPLEQLSVSLIYLNTENTELFREKTHLDIIHSPEQPYSVLDKTKMLEWVDTHKRHYSVYDIQLFHFPMTEDKVQTFICAEIDVKYSLKYWKNLLAQTDQTQWKLEPTVVLFHDLCELFVFYKEPPPQPTPAPTPKSILKTGSAGHATTKKVRILLNASPEEEKKTQFVNRSSAKQRTTRKIRILS